MSSHIMRQRSGSQRYTETCANVSRMSVLGRFPPIDVDPQLIIPTGRLVIVDRSCDAFDPVHADNPAEHHLHMERSCFRRERADIERWAAIHDREVAERTQHVRDPTNVIGRLRRGEHPIDMWDACRAELFGDVSAVVEHPIGAHPLAPIPRARTRPRADDERFGPGL